MTPEASERPPTGRARALAVATIRAACRSGHLELDEAEVRLEQVYTASTFGELYAATSGLPHPPAPLVVTREDEH